MSRKFAIPGVLLAGLLLAVSAAAQPKPAGKAAPKAETGYVVSIGDTAMVVSNIAPGSGSAPAGDRQVFTRTATQGGPGPGKGQGGGVEIELRPGDVVRDSDGKMTLSPEAKKRFTPEQQKMIERDLNSGGGPGGGAWQGGGQMQFQLGPGDVVRGPDGKMTLSAEAKKRFSPEQQQRIQETLNNQSSGGGPVVVRKGPEVRHSDVPTHQGKAPAAAPSAPLQLTDFVLDKKTKSPKGLAKGDKVKVTYVEADGKKVATRIEKEK